MPRRKLWHFWPHYPAAGWTECQSGGPWPPHDELPHAFSVRRPTEAPGKDFQTLKWVRGVRRLA